MTSPRKCDPRTGLRSDLLPFSESLRMMRSEWMVQWCNGFHLGCLLSPKDGGCGTMGPLPNGRTSWLMINEGDPITTEPSPGMRFQVVKGWWTCFFF